MNTTAPRIVPFEIERLRPERRALRARRAEELQLPLAALALERPVEQLVDLLLGERVAVPAVAEPLGRTVAQQLVAVARSTDRRPRRSATRCSASASWSRLGLEHAPSRAPVAGSRASTGRRPTGIRGVRNAHPNRPVM